MRTLVTFCQKTGRRLRLYINRQIAKLSHKGQLRISVAFSLPFLAKLEVSYQVQFDEKSRQRQQAEMIDGAALCQAGRGFLTAEVRGEGEQDGD
ncbi:MAG: hypothetical protein E5W49_24465 [Mesorhizobium sp.]|nr:MAG: hypothetical protein E5W49_24465 [Mesorhizobium sp.]